MGQGLSTKGPIFSGNLSSPPPAGTVTGDMFYWDQDEKKLVKFAAPAAEGTFVLGCVDGVLTWMATKNCSAPAP